MTRINKNTRLSYQKSYFEKEHCNIKLKCMNERYYSLFLTKISNSINLK